MGEILSQPEIDALLEALSSGALKLEAIVGEADQKKIQPFDFHRPNKFSKDQLQSLVTLHENFAKLLTTSLSTYLRNLVRVQVVSIEQQSYDEFTRSLPNPTVMNLLSLSPLLGRIVLEFPMPLAFIMVDRFLGGHRFTADKTRELTEIEQTVVKQVVTKSLTNLKDAWQTVLEVTPVYERLELNPVAAKIAAPADVVVLITLEVKIAETIGLMNICLPYSALEPVIQRLEAPAGLVGVPRWSTAQSIVSIQQRLAQAQVQVTVELGTTTIKLRELLNIESGDVLKLDQSTNTLLNVKIGNQVKFKGSPGVSGSKMAVQIGQIVREE